MTFEPGIGDVIRIYGFFGNTEAENCCWRNWHWSISAEKTIDLEVHWHVFEGNGLFCRGNEQVVEGTSVPHLSKAEELLGACW